MNISKTRTPYAPVLLIAVFGCLLVLYVRSSLMQAQGQTLPRYKVDPSWPKQLPNNWIMGIPTGIFVDKQDHIWVVHRVRTLGPNEIGASLTPPTTECCFPAPSVLEFDSEGNLLKSWGGQGYVPHWPRGEHGIWVDGEENVWIGGAELPVGTNGPVAGGATADPAVLPDRQLLKFSREGKQLLEIGRPSNAPINNQDTTILGGPGEFFVDDAADEVYIADGYLNRRIVVYDTNTGAFKRGWGAYGIPLSQIDNGPRLTYDPAAPPPKQFGSLGYPIRPGVVIDIDISADGLVYVSDRGANRVQIFTKEGKFVKEFLVHPKTLGQHGSVWGTMFCCDATQKYLFVANGDNGFIDVLNREDGTELGEIGHKGRQIGLFDGLEMMVRDSHGNLYTAEIPPNSRFQKFIPLK